VTPEGIRCAAIAIGIVLNGVSLSSCSKPVSQKDRTAGCLEFRWMNPSALSVSGSTVRQVVSSLGDPNRAALFEGSLKAPGASAPRSQLEKHYASAGFPVAANFYGATAQFIISRGDVVLPEPSAQQWIRCSSFEEEQTGREEARRFYDLVLDSWPVSDRPLREMEELLHPKPASCNLLRAWSSVVLSYAGLRNRLVTEEDEELALALTLELGEDAPGILVPPLDGPSGTYYAAASFFHMRGDMVSAYVAARFAKQRMECWGSGNITPESLLELLKPMLGARKTALQQIVEASSQNDTTRQGR